MFLPYCLAAGVLGVAAGFALGFAVFRRDRAAAEATAVEVDARVAERTRQLQATLKQLLVAKQAAESASGAKSQFLARMSRELRTPMNGVLGMTEMLRLSQLNPRQRQLADIVHRSATSVIEVIDDILDFTQIQAQSLAIATVAFDPRAVIEEAVELHAPGAHAKGLELVLALDRSLPGAALGDGARLRQIVSNLLSNAIKFTTSGEIVVRGRAKSVDAERLVLEFIVRDTGPGIAPPLLPTLFSAGGRSAARPRAGSSGLGLAIVKELVELMQGRLGVDSQPGRGTTFSFSVVVKPDPAAGAATPPAFPGLRVLVADANPAARDALAQLLSDCGIEAQTAGGADRALELLRAAAPQAPMHLAFIDSTLPDPAGGQFALRLRADERLRDTRFVLLTRLDPPGAGGLERVPAGGEPLLAKPVRRAQLLEVLAAVTGASGATAPAATAAPGGEPPGLGLAVMLVDDNPVDRAVATAMLESAGCVVITAENGQEALEVLTPASVDVVLMDCLMPVMDGYVAVRDIRRRELQQNLRRVPVVALTASVEEEDRRRCLEAGMDAVLRKPVARAELIAILRRMSAPPADGAAAVATAGIPAAPIPEAASGASVTGPINPGPVLSESILAGIETAGDSELLPELVQTYQRESVAAIVAMRLAGRTGDRHALREALRFLGSTSAALGGEALARACGEAAERVRKGELRDIASGIERIHGEHREFAAALAGHVGRPPEGAPASATDGNGHAPRPTACAGT